METFLTLLIPVTFLAMLVLEHVFPARPLPKVRWWLLKGFVFFVILAALNTVVPALIASAVAGRTLVDLSKIGTIGGALVAFLASDFVAYLVHRFLHTVPFVWRWTHQMHHSAERLDMAGAVYFHPFDLVAQIGPPTLVILLLGVSADAAALAGFVSFFYAMFQHINVRTPQWLGYVIQRPEAHGVHHGRGIHAYNYGNCPIWDILFGTFRNPETWKEEQGFWDGASARMIPMLLGRDVSEPPARNDLAEPAAATATTSVAPAE